MIAAPNRLRRNQIMSEICNPQYRLGDFIISNKIPGICSAERRICPNAPYKCYV